MGNSTPLISGLTCFLVMDFTGEGSGLTVAKIFATMELMVTTRLIVFFLGISINLTIPACAFYGITGRVGSGKSRLLGVILDEIPYYSEKFYKDGHVAYVEQEPIIFSDSLKANILFGQ